ncbi:hypothetical protein RHMOL_Rhmol12G0100000 [Rhododendron molle]|uniref:Uncharacterized protein n=1 Tax=Rhododendron molle TaxID=49168 RepID=A0ACC0LGL8_RHOML|nr:hypothetical protein RHMOL_Rhmol12G0100000 [Rhododendron molle]
MVGGCGLWGSDGSALVVAGSVRLSGWQLCRLDRKGRSVCMSWWRLCRLDRKGKCYVIPRRPVSRYQLHVCRSRLRCGWVMIPSS